MSHSCVQEITSKTGDIIKIDNEGNRVIAASRRPDGSLRKEIKIRPGFLPNEDKERFRSKGVEFKERLQAQMGTTVGYSPSVEPVQKPKKNKKKKPKTPQIEEEEFVVETFTPGKSMMQSNEIESAKRTVQTQQTRRRKTSRKQKKSKVWKPNYYIMPEKSVPKVDEKVIRYTYSGLPPKTPQHHISPVNQYRSKPIVTYYMPPRLKYQSYHSNCNFHRKHKPDCAAKIGRLAISYAEKVEPAIHSICDFADSLSGYLFQKASHLFCTCISSHKGALTHQEYSFCL